MKESLEPAFSPQIREYTIRRKAGSDMSFQAVMNQAPAPPSNDGGWWDPEFPGYALELQVSCSDTRDSWSTKQIKGVSCPVGESSFTIACVKSKRNHDENAKTVCLRFNVITESMSAEEKKACTHRRYHTSEGECWGGGSGSCTVEMITSCDDCGEIIGKSFDYRD